jgi:hypothetical protein
MKFNDKDLNQIIKRGGKPETIAEQINNFKNGFPFLDIIKAAVFNDGMIVLDEAKKNEYVTLFNQLSSKKKLLKFVPASGAASRMFKSLYSAKDEGNFDNAAGLFFEKLTEFAFYQSLNTKIKSDNKTEVLNALLNANGLDYGSMPKGLLEFHNYKNTTRTAVEEHLVEGALYTNNKGKVRLHFTVSPEHKKKFKTLINKTLPTFEKKYGVKFNIKYSEQKPSTDTVAVNKNNEPFRNLAGQMLFRPAGHGALLENLNEQDADIIFIKNIDNVVPDHLKAETITYKKALAGLLLNYQKQIFNFLKRIQKPDTSLFMVNKVLRFIETELNVSPPKNLKNSDSATKLKYAIDKLNRPFRVCGMVKNVGEPGGGPFWVKNQDESVSLHIVESAQIDFNNTFQKNIFETATHFNPVDLICSTKNYKKQKFDLLNFRDSKTGFITEKSQSGKTLKAQELPGLWNGSMANWNTLFVEVPLITFNPVKTVNDLLRKEHQPE